MVMAASPRAPASELEAHYALRTGRLVAAAVTLPCRLAGLNDDVLATATRFADALGLAYQIAGDLRDDGATATGAAGRREDARTLGALIGPQAANRRLAELLEEAQAALSALEGDTGGLRYIAGLVCATVR